MTGHEQIKSNIAHVLADSEAVRAFCVENFGRGALVIVNWFGSDGEPGETESPFIFIHSANGTNDAGFVDEETFSVEIVCGAVDESEEPTRRTEVERTATSNGLVTNGIAVKLEALRQIVEGVVKDAASVGAVARTFTREESSTQDFPLEWVRLTVEFFEPQTL